MIQRGEELRLAAEPCQAFWIGRKEFRQKLQGDVAPQLRIAGAIDLPMPPAPSAPVIS